jgi:hypothetical protein
MGRIGDMMERIDGLFERFAPDLLRQPCLPEPPARKCRDVVRVWRTPEERARAEALLREGNPPKQVASKTGLPYGTVLGWSISLGLKWPKGKGRNKVAGRRAA